MILSIFFAVAIATQGAPSASTEMLGINPPDDFVAANHQRDDSSELLEIVEPPETLDNWSRLITVMIFFNKANVGLENFSAHFSDVLRNTCPGMTETEVPGNVDGRRSIRSTIACARNPQTGAPDYLTSFVVQGDANLMVAQVAFHHSIGEPEAALINRIERSLKVCDQRSLRTCSSRKATGFLPAR